MVLKNNKNLNKNLSLIVLTLFLGVFLIGSISATDYSDTTLSIVNLLKIFIMLSGLVIIAFTLRSFYYGDITFGRLFRIGVIVGFAELFILLLAPVAINYISTLIN